ncbi:MAG: hypothetical protein AAB692_06195 [Patescibacteria group bacterium]
MNTLAARTEKNLADIVHLAIRHRLASKALVVFDGQTPLSRLIADGYRAALPEGIFIDFDDAEPGAVLAAIEALTAGDLVILVQSASFRLNEFRFRIELFSRGLATIEHLHLGRSSSDEQMEVYVDALAYDRNYYIGLGHGLKKKLDAAKMVTVRCRGTTLAYEGGMEPAKLNIGDYSDMKNVGGTFPIGEVFSEPTDLSKANGEAMLFGYAGMDHLIQIHEPFKVKIENGVLTAGDDAPESFRAILELIRKQEDVLVREFGLGLNRAMGKNPLDIPRVAIDFMNREQSDFAALGEWLVAHIRNMDTVTAGFAAERQGA